MELLQKFKYLDFIINQFQEKDMSFPCDNIYLIGGRKSGKTFSIILFCVLMFLWGKKKVRIITFRKYTKDIEQSVWEETLNIMLDIGFVPKTNKKYRRISNGQSIWTFHGLNDKDGKRKKLSGFATLKRYQGVIVHIEEASEFEENEIFDIREAFRGNNNVLWIFSSNPWNLSHWLISYCHAKNKFSEYQLEKFGQQFRTIITNGTRELFHYTNWRVNELLPESDIKQIKQVKFISPQRARVVDIGLPGQEKGAIYGHAIDKVSGKLSDMSLFQGGLDFGFKNDATAMIIIGCDAHFKIVNIISEYYHDNSTMQFKDHKTMAKDIVIELTKLGMIYPILKQGIIIYCDINSYAMIEILNDEVALTNNFWIVFSPCKKIEVNLRVGLQLAIMEDYRMNVNNNCVWFKRELTLARWDDNKTKATILDKDNHTQDAFHYAIIPWYNYLQRKTNPYMLNKKNIV